MSRIIAGSAGGRRLVVPQGRGVRPTSDRVREALFSAVASWCGSLQGLRFLDLYAGSGAVGLEAWSRGAGMVTFVESDRRAAAAAADNARRLGFHRAQVLVAAVGVTLAQPPVAPYDVVFLDPPYPMAAARIDDDLTRLVANQWLVPGALVAVERSARGPGPAWPTGFTGTRERRYGDTVLWYGHAAASPAGSGDPEPARQE